MKRQPSSALVLALASAFGSPLALATPGPLQAIANETAASDPAHMSASAAVARDADGDIVVAWANHWAEEVYFRRYSANPTLDFGGGVKTALTGKDVDAASDALGNFVVVSIDDAVVRGQLFSASGAAVTGAFFIGNAPQGNTDPDNVSVAMEPDGDFVVAWHRNIGTTAGQELVYRRYRADGTAGALDVVTTYRGGADIEADVAIDAAGNFNVVWSNVDVRMQRYNAAGTKLGAEIVVALDEINSELDEPAIAMTPDGRSVVAWRNQRTGAATRILGRRYTNQGVASAPQQLNRDTVGNRKQPDIAIDTDGSYAVVYTSINDTTGPDDLDRGEDVRIGRYLANGTFVRELRANASALLNQTGPAVAVDADGDVVAAWQSGDTSKHQIMVRRFSGQENTDLSLTISDAPEPVPVGGTLEYTLITTNHHAPEAPTAIQAINDAFGTSTRQRLTITLGSGQKYVSATGADWFCAPGGSTAVNCASTRTQAPTTTRSLVLKLTAPTAAPAGVPATTGISAKVVGEQPDDNETGDFVNNFDAESTRLCAKDTLGLEAAHYYLSEGGSTTVRVKRIGAGCGSASVKFVTVSGTARARGDFVQVSKVITWADGDTADKLVTLQSVYDPTPEPTEWFTIQLQNPNAFAVLGTAQASIEIPTDAD